MEYLDVVSENDEYTGIIKTKEQVHCDGDFHRTVHIWLLNEKNELLLQLRSRDKSSFPGYWDISAAGHLQAGETVLQAAVRELAEELGVQADEIDFEYVMKVRYCSQKNNEFGYVFLLRVSYDLSDYRFTDHEVEAVRYVHYVELKQMIADKADHLLVHANEEEVLFEYIENNS